MSDALFDTETVAEIRRMRGNWSASKTAKSFGCSKGTILRIWAFLRYGEKVAKPSLVSAPKVSHPVITMLKDRLNSSPLTMEAVSKKSGVSRSTLIHWFHRGGSPNFANLSDVFELLGCDLVPVPRAQKTPVKLSGPVKILFDYLSHTNVSVYTLSMRCGIPAAEIQSWAGGVSPAVNALMLAMTAVGLHLKVEVGDD